MPESKKTIYQKILAVMGACTNIPKNGYNDHFRYKFVQESDAKETVRKTLIDNKLIIVPVKSEIVEIQAVGSKGRVLTNINMSYRLIDTESGESIDLMMPGSGVDGEDKGMYKAITGSIKYLLTTAFLIPTGDDPERFDKPDAQKPAAKPNNQQQQTVADIDKLRADIATIQEREHWNRWLEWVNKNLKGVELNTCLADLQDVFDMKGWK